MKHVFDKASGEKEVLGFKFTFGSPVPQKTSRVVLDEERQLPALLFLSLHVSY